MRQAVAIVTGGSRGIGRASVLALAAAGFDVGFTYRQHEEEAVAVGGRVRSEGRRAEWARLDLEDPAQARAVVLSLIAKLDGVDVLVNNAGVDHRTPFLEDDLSSWTRMLNVNLLGAVAAAQAAADAMRSRGISGSIINVTSLLDELPVARGAAYCASKAGLRLATEVMALELAEYGIRVNAVAPGHTTTPQNFGPDEIDPRGGEYPEIPLGRPASAAEVARTIAFLASENASYITGCRLLVDGGLTLRSGPQTLEKAVGYEPAYGQARAATQRGVERVESG